ncbi:hypothetical protein K661_02114, partial [Piscirickettsia salmonis LF-89 = ATCC VR-1361]
LSQLSSAKNPNLPRPTHPVLSTPWLAAAVQTKFNFFIILYKIIIKFHLNLFIKKLHFILSKHCNY